MPRTPDGRVIISITADDRPSPLCDFCQSPDILWRYPCASFDLPQYRESSEGDWSACEPCSAIIETVPLPILGNPAAGTRMADLAKRSIDAVYGGGAPPYEDFLPLATFLYDLHGGFFRHRQGPRVADVAVTDRDRPPHGEMKGPRRS